MAGSYTAANKSNRKLSSDRTDVVVAEHIFMLAIIVTLIFTINKLCACFFFLVRLYYFAGGMCRRMCSNKLLVCSGLI